MQKASIRHTTELKNDYPTDPKPLTVDFLDLFCEKNSDGTRTLRLQGKELFQRIGRRIISSDMYRIAYFLLIRPNVTSLDLCYNDFGDSGLEVLSNCYLTGPNNMQHMNIMHCDITDKGMKWLSNSRYLNLKSLRVNGNRLGPVGAKYVAAMIEKCKQLELLDIAETSQTIESIESLLILLETCNLKYLNISRVLPKQFYSTYNSDMLADDLGILFHLNKTLTELSMSKCFFDSHDVELLLSGLENNLCLQFLDLSCNNLGDHGIQHIATWLKTRPVLLGLNISANQIRDYGARFLSFGLPYSRVRFLDISYNHITDFGMIDLLCTLKKSTMHRRLFMWGNKISEKTNLVIDRMLKSQVLEQDQIDIFIYHVDGKAKAAYYPANNHKQLYYCVQKFGTPPFLKIERNFIPTSRTRPRPLIGGRFYNRYPEVDRKLGEKVEKKKICSPITSKWVLKYQELAMKKKEELSSKVQTGDDCDQT